jgi:prephenate dehydrogenase
LTAGAELDSFIPMRRAVNGFRQITIIGVGLLGGSIGLAVKARHPETLIVGVGRRRLSLSQALKRGAIDRAYLEDACPQAVASADLVVLATPVGAFERYLRAIRNHLKPGAIVTDVGSTKSDAMAAARRVLKAGHACFVGSHPMAGSERKGVVAADPDMLTGALCVITPGRAPRATARVEAFWRELGMRTVRMSPAAHDKAVARISHLPHLLSVALMCLPQRAELRLAAGGFRDMTRLAGGDPEMWRDILLSNRREIQAAMDEFSRRWSKLRRLVKRADGDAAQEYLRSAQRARLRNVTK